MTKCVVYSVGDRVAVLRIDPEALRGLATPNWAEAWAILASLGGDERDWLRLRASMAEWTEEAAIRAFQDRDIPGGIHYKERHAEMPQAQLDEEAATVHDISIMDEVGLLARGTPTEIARCRRFRDCWRRPGAAIPQVNMPLARVQRMNEVRGERRPKLAKSDVDLLKAQESGNTTLQTQLRTYRQALRDVPQTQQANVDACTTPEQLETWAPTWPIDPAP